MLSYKAVYCIAWIAVGFFLCFAISLPVCVWCRLCDKSILCKKISCQRNHLYNNILAREQYIFLFYTLGGPKKNEIFSFMSCDITCEYEEVSQCETFCDATQRLFYCLKRVLCLTKIIHWKLHAFLTWLNVPQLICDDLACLETYEFSYTCNWTSHLHLCSCTCVYSKRIIRSCQVLCERLKISLVSLLLFIANINALWLHRQENWPAEDVCQVVFLI